MIYGQSLSSRLGRWRRSAAARHVAAPAGESCSRPAAHLVVGRAGPRPRSTLRRRGSASAPPGTPGRRAPRRAAGPGRACSIARRRSGGIDRRAACHRVPGAHPWPASGSLPSMRSRCVQHSPCSSRSSPGRSMVTRRDGFASCRHRGQMTFKTSDTWQTRCHVDAPKWFYTPRAIARLPGPDARSVRAAIPHPCRSVTRGTRTQYMSERPLGTPEGAQVSSFIDGNLSTVPGRRPSLTRKMPACA